MYPPDHSCLSYLEFALDLDNPPTPVLELNGLREWVPVLKVPPLHPQVSSWPNRAGLQEARERGKTCFKAKGWLEHVGDEQEACRQEEYVHVWLGWVSGTDRPFPGKVASRKGKV